MGASAHTETNTFEKIAGPMGWLVGIVTAVVFIGLLYNGMQHGDAGHGADHGAAHAAPAEGAAAGH